MNDVVLAMLLNRSQTPVGGQGGRASDGAKSI